MRLKFKLLSLGIIYFIFFALWAGLAFGGTTLTWDGVTDADGYIVYFTDQTKSYNYNVTSGVECDTNLLNLARDIKYTFKVTAYNNIGESGFSNSVTYTAPSFDPPLDILPPPTTIIINGPVNIVIQ